MSTTTSPHKTLSVMTLYPVILASKDMMNMDIYSKKEQKIGIVRELMLNPQTGIIMYLIICYGGFLGMGERLTAVPWARVKLNSPHIGKQTHLILDVDIDTLLAAPHFDCNTWPNMCDNQWAETIKMYYSKLPEIYTS
jgi:sporulation protein YlmC with PRC-barrel domain